MADATAKGHVPTRWAAKHAATVHLGMRMTAILVAKVSNEREYI